MKINFATIFTLVSSIIMEIQEIYADKVITVKELYKLLGDIIQRAQLEDKVIFEKKKDD